MTCGVFVIYISVGSVGAECARVAKRTWYQPRRRYSRDSQPRSRERPAIEMLGWAWINNHPSNTYP